MSQIKKREKFSEKELNEMEANKLLDTEFKTLGCKCAKGIY